MNWPSTKATRVRAALLRIGWRLKRQGGTSHQVLEREGMHVPGELRKEGRRIRIQGQPLQVLLALLERPGDVVTREELHQRLWPADTFVAFDTGLNAAIKRLRTALGDDAERPQYVETLPRVGYRFIAAIIPSDLATTAPLTIAPAMGGPRRWWIAAVTITVVVLGAAAATAIARRHPVDAHRVPSLAVLPFDNLSPDRSQDVLAQALTDELITTLGSVSSLHVVSRGSVFQYKDRHVAAAEIGRAL